MPVSECEEHSLRFAEGRKGLHKTFRIQKLTFLGNFSSWLTRHSLKRSYKQAVEVGYTSLEKTSLIRNYSLLLNLENFESDFC